MCCERTIYSYIDYKPFSAKNIDFPQKTQKCFTVYKNYRVGRTYERFKSFLKENSDIPVVEMVTLEGVKSEKVLLTLHFIRHANTPQSLPRKLASWYLLTHIDS